MPENTPAQNLPPVTPPAKPKQPAEMDRAHVPMSEEFDRAKWTLPPVGMILIGIAIFAVILGFVMYGTRAKPVLKGGIADVNAVQLQDNTILAAVQINLGNSTDKAWYIKEIKGTVQSDAGEQTDTAATASDSQRYFQAFPALGSSSTQVLQFDQKIMPGQQVAGTVVFSFPITKDQFDKRKSLTVVVQPFDTYPVTLTK